MVAEPCPGDDATMQQIEKCNQFSLRLFHAMCNGVGLLGKL
jgi:hypothetical protein